MPPSSGQSSIPSALLSACFPHTDLSVLSSRNDDFPIPIHRQQPLSKDLSTVAEFSRLVSLLWNFLGGKEGVFRRSDIPYLDGTRVGCCGEGELGRVVCFKSGNRGEGGECQGDERSCCRSVGNFPVRRVSDCTLSCVPQADCSVHVTGGERSIGAPLINTQRTLVHRSLLHRQPRP